MRYRTKSEREADGYRVLTILKNTDFISGTKIGQMLWPDEPANARKNYVNRALSFIRQNLRIDVYAHSGVGYSLVEPPGHREDSKRKQLAALTKLEKLEEDEAPKARFIQKPIQARIPERPKIYYEHTGFIPYPSRNRLMGSK
jgi:hypothetical protein